MTHSEELAKKMVKCFKSGGKVLICGNGGSASMADHFAGELMGKYQMERPSLPAVSLNGIATLTAIANDYGYTFVFRRQIEALGRKGDLLVTMTTSGNSANIHWAEEKAREIGMDVYRLPTNKELRSKTAGSQEAHLRIIHKACGLVEKEMFG